MTDRQPDDDGYAAGETAVLGGMLDEAMGRGADDTIKGIEEADDLDHDVEPGPAHD